MTRQVRILIIATLLISGMLIVGSLLLGKRVQLSQLNISQSTPKDSQDITFDSQTATVNAEIVKVDGAKSITVKKDDQTKDLPLSARVMIYKYQPGTTTATSSADLKTIETRKALIVLEMRKDQYQVISISYLSGL